ncbi:FapA family protein [Oceanidesulfovibrio marinus]|uniref:Flagellar Assembly Protein A N-terminal region domain-containing protein n=1 Tax=Oceanidesulfovibrio marinus TaxID=370038 RepID=A0A6P1ZIZ8_9BACT|nr:FapA family protein [Oceanidesulfovibrio marinus]TVM33120.1 hypothetical protein DQK91_13250 [Oceanidesulfovibrio marinus]
MGRTIIHIDSDNEQAARKIAAERFRLSPDSIHIEPVGQGVFAASVELPGPLTVRMDKDLLEARVDASPPEPGMRAPSRAEIMNILAAAGIKIPPKQVSLETLMQRLAQGEAVQNLLIAEGRPPQRSRDGNITPQGDWSFPVVPGDDIGVIVPAEDAQPGMLVTGTALPPQGPAMGEPVEFTEKPLCRIDKNSYTVRSETYGMVQFAKNVLSIKPAFTVQENGLALVADIFAQDNEGRPFTAARYRDIFAMLDFVEGFDEHAVDQAIASAKETGAAQRMSTVCRGRKPVHGIDGWFEMLYQDERSAVGSQSKDGSIDFRERGVVRSVKQNELIGILHPPVPGTPGRDIFGRIVPASDGRPFDLVCEENVAVLEDGKTYYATLEGMVFLHGNQLNVTDVYKTKGDVNLTTGNLSLEKGSLYVSGSILTGFNVYSPANVYVEEVVESANVKAEGSVEVKGGIIMDGGGQVRAGQNISALFMKNANVVADGNVIVKHEISTSEARADGKVIAMAGRGKVFGSQIHCGEGMEVQELGNEAGVETIVHLGRQLQLDPALIARKKELTSLLDKIYDKLGSDSPKAIMQRTRPDLRESVKKILQTRIQAAKELAEITNAIREERARQRRDTKAQIKVHKLAYPGVIIHGYGSRLDITEATAACRIYFDQSENMLVIGTL